MINKIKEMLRFSNILNYYLSMKDALINNQGTNQYFYKCSLKSLYSEK